MTSRILTLPEVTLPQSRMITYAMVFLGLTVGYFLLRGSNWTGSTQLHTVMESIASLLALLVGVLALVRFYSKKNNTFLFIGTGFVGTAFLDGYHAVVTSSFFADQFPSAPSSLIPWSWIASRLFLAVLLWLSWVAWRRETKLGEKGKIGEREVYLFAAGLTVISFLFFAIFPLPRAYYPELMFHRPEEFVPALFFLVALVGYLKKGLWKIDAFEHWLVLSLIVGFVGQAMFMSFSGQLFDMEFDTAHLLKKVSYIAVLVGLLINIYHLFQQTEKHKTELESEITERKRGEETLVRQAEELAQRTVALEVVNRELEAFSYSVSHDLRAPLRSVNGFSQALLEDYREKLDELGQDYLHRVRAASQRMSDLIDDLLQLSRVTRSEMSPEAVDLSWLARTIAAELQESEPERRVQFVVSESLVANGDTRLLRLALHNLLSNAWKFTAKHPRALIEFGVAWREGKLVYFVQDDGVGFDMAYADKLFKAFQRLHSPAEFEGTGIGLATVQRIIHRHGGRVWAEGAVEQGATFYFTLQSQESI